jgi:two-component system, sensor histidine kinase and response regulator
MGIKQHGKILAEKSDLPIIALSVAVMEADQYQARQAGMVAHLAKPIDEQELYLTLATLFNSTKTLSRDEYLKGADSSFPFDLEGFDCIAGLKQADGDTSFYHQLLIQFKSQITTEFFSIITFLDQGDLPAACRVAHTLKGTAGIVGAWRQARAASMIDSTNKEKSMVPKAIRLEMKDALESAARDLTKVPSLQKKTTPIGHEDGKKAVLELQKALEKNKLVDDNLLDDALRYIQTSLTDQNLNNSGVLSSILNFNVPYLYF